jgi:hypothetical protein
VSSLIQLLPAGTAYFIGIVLITMMTGRLVQTKGSLARAAFPFVVHLRWGWHRVERALERGKLSLDTLFDATYHWCLTHLEAEAVCLGPQQREVLALDTSTIARWRADKGLGLAGKGYYYRAGRAVRANIVAALTSVVMIGGIRCGLVRRTRFAATCEQAIAQVFANLPKTDGKRLIVVDAGIATKEQFAASNYEDALMGRLRINAKLRAAPPPPTGKRGRPFTHGAVLHPGREVPELAPDQECQISSEKGEIRLRRWNRLHYEEYPETVLDVVRVDDPAYIRPLIVATTARELSSEEFRIGYGHRSVVETNFYVGQDSAAMEMPRAWQATAIERRISMALIAATLLKAIAARCEPLATGPWDRKPERTGGRLANHLDLHAMNFSALALKGVAPRNHRKNQSATNTKDLQLEEAA